MRRARPGRFAYVSLRVFVDSHHRPTGFRASSGFAFCTSHRCGRHDLFLERGAVRQSFVDGADHRPAHRSKLAGAGQPDRSPPSAGSATPPSPSGERHAFAARRHQTDCLTDLPLIRRTPQIPGRRAAVGRPQPPRAPRARAASAVSPARSSRRNPSRTPKSSTGSTSGRPSVNISSISTVQRPTPADCRQALDRGTSSGEPHRRPPARHHARLGVPRDVAQRRRLRSPRNPQPRSSASPSASSLRRRRQCMAGLGEASEAAQDRLRRAAMQLLVGDGPQQRLVGFLVVPHLQPARADPPHTAPRTPGPRLAQVAHGIANGHALAARPLPALSLQS